MFLAFLRVQTVMELNNQGSQLNIVAQINYSNSKRKIKEENKNRNMYKSFFLSLSLSSSALPRLFMYIF